ncbi:MAG: aspartate/glutamate racemase family protein [Candidatus Paceibacterota bacterium]
MKIGIFDSGLGGLIIAKAIRKVMPEYDYVYLGDTKRVPYGNRSHEAVYEFTREAVDYLFRKENCVIIIIACNTASARALRRIQQEYLLKNFPDRKILGVLIPSAEEAAKYERVGILGTQGTINSNTFPKEIWKVNLKKKKKNLLSPLLVEEGVGGGDLKKNHFALKGTPPQKGGENFFFTKVFQNSAPMLVPLIEEGEKVLAVHFLKKYLKPFLNNPVRSRSPQGDRNTRLLTRMASNGIDALVLGCTHYPFYKKEIKKILNKGSESARGRTRVISQDEIIPKKLKDYFVRHSEIEKKLSKNKKAKILVTDITPNIKKLSQKWFGKDTKPELIHL